MAPKYKLIYFTMQGFAEPIRWILSQVNEDFEDIRYSDEEWKGGLKEKTPWNVLPVLEVDGKSLSQTMAIMRYLGRKHGLAPQDEWLLAKCDEYLDAMSDVKMETVKMYYEKDDEKKAAMKKDFQANCIPKAWTKFNEILKKNGTGFLVGDKLTYTDIWIGFYTEYLFGFMTGYFPQVEFTMKMDDYPELLKHQKMVKDLPGVKAWIAKRPQTPW